MSIVGFEQEATTVRTTILRKRTRECEHTSSLCFIILPAPAIFTFHVFFFLYASLTIPLTLLAV